MGGNSPCHTQLLLPFNDICLSSDLYLIPVAMFRDPFMGGTSKLVLCEVYNPDKKPNATNFRASCAANMLKVRDGSWHKFKRMTW